VDAQRGGPDLRLWTAPALAYLHRLPGGWATKSAPAEARARPGIFFPGGGHLGDLWRHTAVSEAELSFLFDVTLVQPEQFIRQPAHSELIRAQQAAGGLCRLEGRKVWRCRTACAAELHFSPKVKDEYTGFFLGDGCRLWQRMLPRGALCVSAAPLAADC
jgi:hypothetical protein